MLDLHLGRIAIRELIIIININVIVLGVVGEGELGYAINRKEKREGMACNVFITLKRHRSYYKIIHEYRHCTSENHC